MIVCWYLVAGFELARALVLNYRPESNNVISKMLVALRIMAATCGGASCYCYFIGYDVTESRERTTLAVLVMMAANAGWILGPLLTSLMLKLEGPSESIYTTSASPIYAVAVVWAFLATMASFVVPSDPSRLKYTVESQRHLSNTAENEQRSVNDDSHHRLKTGGQLLKREHCKVVLTMSTAYFAERGFSGGMLEVATSLILEQEFAWDVVAIGHGISCSFAAVLIFGIFITAATQGSLVNQTSILMVLACISPLASLCLFKTSWLTGSATQLLVADSLIFASMFNAASLLQGLAIKVTKEGTACSKDNFLAFCTVASKTARFVGASSGRTIYHLLDRNGYAAAQMSVALLSCCGILKVLPLLPNK